MIYCSSSFFIQIFPKMVIFVYEMSIFSMKNVHFTVCVFKNERIKSHFVYVMTYDSCILLFKNERIKSRFLMLNI